MDVTVTEFRAHLSDWIDRITDGTEVVVTDRGIPVVRILGIEAAPMLERLTDAGVISRPRHADRPTAAGRVRLRARESAAAAVVEQRR